MTLRAFPVFLIVACCGLPGYAQVERKSYTLNGTVQRVNAETKRLAVANDAIPGGMGAMTMNYAVDQEDVLKLVKPGDRITARVFEGETILYSLQVVPVVVRDAAAGAALHLDDLERMALAGNPTLDQAQANIRMAAGHARQTGLYPNPTVGYYGDEIRGGYSNGGRQGAFVSQTIVTGGKLRAARRVADVMTAQTETSGEIQRLRILNNVRILFYRVLAGQRLVEVRDRLATLAGDATQTSHQLANVGQADRPDVLQAEVEQQQANVSAMLARKSLQASWRTLAAVVGQPDLPVARLEGEFEAIPDLTYEEWFAATLRGSPELKLAVQAVERAEAALVVEKKVPIPDLQLTANLSQNNQPLMDTSPRIAGVNGGVQVGIQVPVFNRNQGSIAAAKAQIESSKQDLARVKLQIARDVASLFRDYESARESARQYKTEMLPRAEEAYRLYQTNYRNMAAAYPQALISQRTLFQLEADYVQVLETAWQSLLAIRGFGLLGERGGGLSMPVAP